MGAYFHQDYEEFGDVWDNVDLFVSDSPDLASVLPGEITRILDSFGSEEQVRDFVHQIGGQVGPLEGEGGYRGLLTKIAERVSRSLGA